jgi:hypothetical protein
MQFNPKFNQRDTVYYISLEETKHECLVCSGNGRIKKLFHKCPHCNNGVIKTKEWIIRYHFERAFIRQIIVDLQHDNELQYVLEGCNLCLWEANMFLTEEDARDECKKRNA